MDKTFSVVIDFTRFLAALLVFFHHAEQILHDSRLSLIASFGHDAVIFFFILSGFVIGYVAREKEKNITDYSIARLARIYSVALPSLLLAYILYLLGNHYFPQTYIAPPPHQNWAKIFISSVFFFNQSQWWLSAVPTNGPYWSICYEAWYYAIFGIAFYLSGYKKYLLLAIAILAAGFKILLLMPIWLLGFLCFIHHKKLMLSKIKGYVLMLLSIASYLGIRYTNFDDTLLRHTENFMGGKAHANDWLGFSKKFIPDYMIALLFVSFFSGVYTVRDQLKNSIFKCQKAIKLFSSFTFSLYLYHFPILLFLSCFTDSSFFVLSTCLITIAILGYFSERKKYVLVSLLRRLFCASN